MDRVCARNRGRGSHQSAARLTGVFAAAAAEFVAITLPLYPLLLLLSVRPSARLADRPASRLMEAHQFVYKKRRRVLVVFVLVLAVVLHH